MTMMILNYNTSKKDHTYKKGGKKRPLSKQQFSHLNYTYLQDFTVAQFYIYKKYIIT